MEKNQQKHLKRKEKTRKQEVNGANAANEEQVPVKPSKVI